MNFEQRLKKIEKALEELGSENEDKFEKFVRDCAAGKIKESDFMEALQELMPDDL